MAHLVARSEPASPVFYNIDGSVGAAPAANLREDVLLVQFAFAAMAADPRLEASMEFYRAICEVRATGTIDLATINAIKALQIEVKKLKPDTTVNGRVSPANVSCSCGADASTIMNLNEFVHHTHIGLWPRIDKIPGCPLELKQMVVRTVQGSQKV